MRANCENLWWLSRECLLILRDNALERAWLPAMHILLEQEKCLRVIAGKSIVFCTDFTITFIPQENPRITMEILTYIV